VESEIFKICVVQFDLSSFSFYCIEAFAAHAKESYADYIDNLFLDKTRNSLPFVEPTVCYRSKQESANVSSLKSD
jgi:hypothetical protein